jgi:methylated-DNA-[protein]-cysteine S-methyltransferase
MSCTMETDLESEIRAGRLNDGMSFNQKVWTITARIPKGCVTTYAEIARALGSNGYRAVGNALNKNPYAPQVPCHRVVGSNGALTGFAAGLVKKTEMLTEEGIAVKNGRAMVASFYRF